MILRIFIILQILQIPILVCAQNKRDYVWIMGVENDLDPEHENYLFDFNKIPFTVDSLDGALEFDGNNAIISDYDGNLLFYSNGCAVANREHQIMPNGHDINEGEWFDIVWQGDCSFGYPGTQEVMALPDPYNDQGHYLITKLRNINPNGPVFLKEFQYSYIDMSLDGGLGDVTIKNEVIYDQDTIQSSYLQAVKHNNEKDWWLIQPSDEKNRYLKFLIDSTGLHLHHVQEIGPDFHYNSGAGGKAKFSPDGSLYAYYNRHMQLLLYDFDRSTGELNNLREIYIDSIPTFNTIEFSASGQFLYFGLKLKLYQLDIKNLNDDDSLVLIDEWNGTLDPFPTVFTLMQRGPDCRIYVCSGSSTKSYSVINHPDEKGVACDFVQQGVQLPHVSGRASFPNFPNFRIDEEEICDPTLSSIFNIPINIASEISLYPNPANDEMKIESIEEFSNFIIRDINGKTVQKGKYEQTVILENISKGIYFISLRKEDGKIDTKKFVKS